MPAKKKPKPRRKSVPKEKGFYDDTGWTSLNSRPYGYGFPGAGRTAPSTAELLASFSDVVYSAINLIAPAVARACDKFKLVVETRPGDDRPKSLTKALDRQARERIARRAAQLDEVSDHGLLDLLAAPNPHQSFRRFVELIDTYLELAGSAFVYIQRAELGERAIPTALWVLPAECVSIETDPTTGELLHYKFQRGGENRYFPPEQVVHFKFVNPLDPYTSFGVSPVRAVWERINLLESEQQSWQSVLQSMTFPTILIYPPDNENYTPAQAQRIEKQLLEKGRLGGSQGGIWVVSESMKVAQYQTPPKDLSALQMYQSIRSSIATAFNIPLVMLDMAETSSEASDVARRNFETYCLLPRVELILETISHHLCGPRMWLCADTVVSADKVFELQKITGLVGADVITINEARSACGFPPLSGGDKLHSEISPLGTPSAQTFTNSYAPPRRKSAGRRYRSRHPDPQPLADALRPVFESLGRSVLAGVGGKSLGGTNTKSFVPIDRWTDEMRRALIPVVRLYMGEGAEGVLGAVGSSPDIRRHAVQELDRAVNGLVLALADSTLSTTASSVEAAVEATREAIRGGLNAGEADAALATRIKEIFTALADRHCRVIAETEANRAKHSGEAIALRSAGLEAKKEWTPDTAACPRCRGYAGRGALPLDTAFETGGGPYGTVEHPPGHPGCRCTLVYEFPSD